MKTFRAKTGPFDEQPYFSDTEIENTCIDELRRVSLYPQSPEPIRIDRFIEKRFNIVPTYEELGKGILGLTVFGPSGVKEIIVSRELDEDGSILARRRIRTTLAHESGHGLFHTYLFAMSQKQPLFADLTDPASPKILCRDEAEMGTGYRGQWWEFQANKAIGALLMPRQLVEIALAEFTVTVGSMSLPVFDRGRHAQAITALSAVFDVNPAVARIRLNQILPASNSMQLTL